MLKHGPQNKEKKLLSAAGLLREVRKVFEKIPSVRTNARGRERNISVADSLMSALAMFSLKSPSLLAFDQALKDQRLPLIWGKKTGIIDFKKLIFKWECTPLTPWR